jgi:uncharacterized membrane protein
VKITAILGGDGRLVAIVHAHLSEHDRQPRSATVPHATLRAQPGQVFHEVIAPEALRGQPHDLLRRWVVEHVGAAAGPDQAVRAGHGADG